MNVASIPGWSAKDGDEIICIAELKLGLIGMSCTVPGFTTMVTMIQFVIRCTSTIVDDEYLSHVCLQNSLRSGNGKFIENTLEPVDHLSVCIYLSKLRVFVVEMNVQIIICFSS